MTEVAMKEQKKQKKCNKRICLKANQLENEINYLDKK